jgi:hypothetical protein
MMQIRIFRGGPLFWATSGLALLILILVCVNTVLMLGNRSSQAEVNARQQFINQSIQLSRLHQDLVNTLASTSVKNKNDALRQILAEVGIIVTSREPTADQPAEQKAPASSGAKSSGVPAPAK